MIISTAIGVALAKLALEGGTELTVYNQGFALVKESRNFNLVKGTQTLLVEDVAQLIEPSSVGIRSLGKAGLFEVLEQNYQYDLISTAAILNKAVGQQIALVRVLPNGQKERIEGTLLSAPTAVVANPGGGSSYTYNGMVLRATDGRILLDPSGEIEVRSIPDGLISKPTLVWEVDSQASGNTDVELSYITQGMSWSSDYVLQLDESGKIGTLKGWVTLNNNAGVTFKNAKLKLLAGDVQRAESAPAGRAGAAMRDAMKSEGGFAEEQFAEYHLYTLQRPATVRNKEMKQLSLLEADKVPVKKKLVIDAMRMYRGWRAQEGEVGTGNIKPQFRVEFKNDKESNLGMPLPQGKFKVFQRDSSGSVQLLGEDRIDHTPRNEELSLVVGRSFDIVATRKRTHFEYIRDAADRNRVRGARESFEIEVRNRKETAETVNILERFYSEWSITAKNHGFTKVDSDTIEFILSLKANEVKKVTYTVEYRW